jgi:Zn-dependent peptidase ImmA (M78 family)/transcriptional regulator with XRE-family HTH domain
MVIDQKQLGERLKKLRERRGHTQEEIAEALGIPRSSVVQLESGKRSLDSLELITLSRELGFDPTDLFGTEFNELQDSVTVLFRAEPKVASDKKLRKTISQWATLCRQFTFLEKLVGADRCFVGPVRYEFQEPRNRWEAIQQGALVAEQERGRLRLGTGPVPELPETIEGQGVRVGSVPLDESVSGLFLSDANIGLSILVNSAHSEQRQLFSFAHEYSHLLFDRARRGNISRAENREENIEARANSFAAAFLMPEGGIREFLSGVGKGSDVPTLQEVYDEGGGAVRAQRRGPAQVTGLEFYDIAHLAFYFGVSYEAALWRLKSVQIISEDERERLAQKQDAANAFRKVLGKRFAAHRQRFNCRDGSFQHKLLSVALEAFRLGEISKMKLREIAREINIADDELKQLLTGIDTDSESANEGIRLPT